MNDFRQVLALAKAKLGCHQSPLSDSDKGYHTKLENTHAQSYIDAGKAWKLSMVARLQAQRACRAGMDSAWIPAAPKAPLPFTLYRILEQTSTPRLSASEEDEDVFVRVLFCARGSQGGIDVVLQIESFTHTKRAHLSSSTPDVPRQPLPQKCISSVSVVHTVQDLIRLKTNSAAHIIRAVQRRLLPYLDLHSTQERAIAALMIDSIADARLKIQAQIGDALVRWPQASKARARAREEARKTVHESLLAEHAAAQKRWRAERAKVQRARLEALKADDLEGYLRLVQTAKSSRITLLLAQTEACLRELTARLLTGSTSDVIPDREGPWHLAGGGTPHNGPASSTDGCQETTQISDFSSLHQSSQAWNCLSGAFTSAITSQPLLLKGGRLREYQLQGLSWMLSLRSKNLNGILADEMGLGKTVQVIALVAHCLGEQQRNDHIALGSSTDKPFLIAAPASVLPNWEKEFAVWAPEIITVSYRGDADAREDTYCRRMRPMTNRRGSASSGAGHHPKMYGFHVVLTSYEYLMGKSDRPRLASIPWSYIIIDEGHRLKNAGCKLNGELRTYTAAHRLLLTGTPLQNNLDELWALLNFLMPSLFESSDDFATWFGGAGKTKVTRAESARGEVEPSNDNNASEDDEVDDARHAEMLSEEEMLIVTSRLHQVLRPFMLRRLKESVAGDLPAKTERLLACEPSAYQQGLFAALEARLGTPGGVRGVSNTLMELRTICNHPLISRLHQDGAEHSMLPLHPLPPEIRLCGKLEMLDRILLKLRAAKHRVLIFCTMTRLLDILESHLEWRGLQFLRLDGSTSAADRGRLVDDFNASGSPYFAFLLSVRAGGVGLNLQSADTVIFYDTDWNPQADSQAAARAHRIGQTREVLILRLQTKGTVEERVVAVAADKQGMVDRSITGGFFDGLTGAVERQRYLLSLLREQAVRRQEEGDKGSERGNSLAPTGSVPDEEMNRLIARGDHELELFEAEDRRRHAAEVAAWRKSSTPKGQDEFSRLATVTDVRHLLEAAEAALTPKDPDEGREFGRGKRARGAVRYPI